MVKYDKLCLMLISSCVLILIWYLFEKKYRKKKDIGLEIVDKVKWMNQNKQIDHQEVTIEKGTHDDRLPLI